MEDKKIVKKCAINRIEEYEKAMRLQELAENTIEKYRTDVLMWLEWADDYIDKDNVIKYKSYLCQHYAATSVNSKIISVNRYLKWMNYSDMVVKIEKMQKNNGLDNTITKESYLKMLEYAETHNKRKLYCIMKTIAHTGIRIGELKYVTVEALNEGSALVWNKGKYRIIYFTENLSRELLRYCVEIKCYTGVVFSGREIGRPITSGAVWKSLKYIARKVGIPEMIVYPHSFRHLFAKEYMKTIGDISELADLLGHSSLETTWIYTKTTSDEKRKRLEMLDL